MKEIITIFSVHNLHPESINDDIREDLWQIHSRATEIDGREVRKEIFGPDGEVHTRIEVDYDENGRAVQIREFTDGESVPSKHEVRTYNSAGKTIYEDSYFSGELATRTYHEYDGADRAISTAITESDEKPKLVKFTYADGSMDCIREDYWLGEQKWKEITRIFQLINGKMRLMEKRTEILDHNKDQSRIKRYFYDGMGPNNATVKIYNRKDKFINEQREFLDEKGRLARVELHDSDSAHSVPYQSEEYTYDNNDQVIQTRTIVKGKTTYSNLILRDDQKRVVRSLEQMPFEDMLYIYKYETAV